MKRSRVLVAAGTSLVLVLAACASTPGGTSEATSGDGGGGGGGGDLDAVRLQLQWAPQAQFAGYFAADKQGYFTAENLTEAAVHRVGWIVLGAWVMASR